MPSIKMKGGGVNILEEEENFTFRKKLLLWKRRTENHNFENFSLLNNYVSQSKIKDLLENGDIFVPRK